MKKYILPLVLILILAFSINCFATPWEVDTAEYAEKSYHETQEATPHGIAFNSDGTKMYIMGEQNYTVYQYTLSTGWDVSTATYASKYKDVGDEDTYPYGIAFSSDGTKMYIVGYANNTVYQYTLSTGWDVSTATYASKYKDVGDEDAYPYGIAFNSDGTKMYIVGYWNYIVYQYTLSTVWDISTATYAEKYKDVGKEDDSPLNIAFSSDGIKMYIVGEQYDTIFQYTLSTAWDVSTATYASKYKYVGDEDTFPYGVAFNSDGTKMYIVGDASDTVYQYTLPAVGIVWNGVTITKWNGITITKWNTK